MATSSNQLRVPEARKKVVIDVTASIAECAEYRGLSPATYLLELFQVDWANIEVAKRHAARCRQQVDKTPPPKTSKVVAVHKLPKDDTESQRIVFVHQKLRI